MKICIPINQDKGMASRVNMHFGSAINFFIYDEGAESFDVIANGDAHHAHGMCQPLSQLMGKDIGSVICGGMGARAVQKLNEGGIKAFRAKEDGLTVTEILEQFRSGDLDEITPACACQEHHCH